MGRTWKQVQLSFICRLRQPHGFLYNKYSLHFDFDNYLFVSYSELHSIVCKSAGVESYQCWTSMMINLINIWMHSANFVHFFHKLYTVCDANKLCEIFPTCPTQLIGHESVTCNWFSLIDFDCFMIDYFSREDKTIKCEPYHQIFTIESGEVVLESFANLYELIFILEISFSNKIWEQYSQVCRQMFCLANHLTSVKLLLTWTTLAIQFNVNAT